MRGEFVLSRVYCISKDSKNKGKGGGEPFLLDTKKINFPYQTRPLTTTLKGKRTRIVDATQVTAERLHINSNDSLSLQIIDVSIFFPCGS